MIPFKPNRENTIMLGVAGSYAYGTNTEYSDVDIRGVCITPMANRLSYRQTFTHFDGDVPSLRGTEPPWTDAKIYDVSAFVSRAAKASPDVLELLFLPSYRIADKRWDYIHKHRRLFLSMACMRSFVGSAHGRLHKMQRSAPIGVNWKDAMHLIRLMRMGHELVSTGEMNVQRPDAAELLGIRHGAWNYQQVIDEADRIEATITTAMSSSPLPQEPDHDRIDRILYEVITWKT